MMNLSRLVGLAMSRNLRSNSVLICCRPMCTNGSDYEVYSGPLSRSIRGVKAFSLLSSASGLFAQPVIIEKAAELNIGTSALFVTCGVVGFFTFVTPVLLHFITKKYVTSIVYHPKEDSYSATTISLFLRKKTTHFLPGEAVVPDIPGMFTSLTVRGIPLFVDHRFFTDIVHYKKIMGYDKPMDFKLSPTASNKSD